MQEKWWKLLVFTYLSVSFLFSAGFLIWLLSRGGYGAAAGDIIRANTIYFAAGAMGGSLYALRIFHSFHEKPLTTRYIYWYFMRPYLCGGTAVALIILFESGILLLQVNDSISARIGLSFLVGFGYGKLMEKLTQMAEVLFNGGDSGKQQP